MDGALLRIQPLHESNALDTTAARRDADDYGYLFFRRLIGADQILALRRRVLENCRRAGWVSDDAACLEAFAQPGIRLGAYDERWLSFQQRVLPLPEFVALGRHAAILGILENVFGGPVMSDRGNTCRVMSPRAPEFTTPPHQDYYYVRGSTELWTVWLPLGDCPTEQGGLAVLPGSRALGLLPHAGDGPGRQGAVIGDDGVWATGDYACGDVLMFHCLTVHRALDNLSADRLRISVDYRYQPARHPDVHD
jgi:ectoine hydroxylase-related dioxygenase (phytanoyl-CoA dioxygenase family)